MKFFVQKIIVIGLLLGVFFNCFGQSNKWKLIKDKDGIRVYESETPNSNFKSIKVECTLIGTYDKLIATLSDVPHHKDWVYNNKTAYIIKKITPYDFYYYTETSIPWPMSNRDDVVHLKIMRDSLPKFLKISAIGEANFIPEKSGKVRVLHTAINWYITMPTSRAISIVYVFQADPGGSLPAWLVNSFADKGPYESFKKLGEILKR
jgi:hypothetical protein